MARTIAKDHDDKRRHILKTAASVFAREGLARASMNQLALDCGISKATIYHYYDGKDALLFDILKTHLTDLRDRVGKVPLTGLSPSDRLRRIVSEILLAYEGMDNEHKIQSEGLPLLPPQQQAELRAVQRDLVAQVSAILADIAPAVFAGDAPKLRSVTMSVFGMLNWFYMWNSHADGAEREAYADLVSGLTLDGLRGV